jgi:hypothetical protein
LIKINQYKEIETIHFIKMRILSWDVGIHHLSYCVLEQNDETKKIEVLHWGIIDLVDSPEQKKNVTLIYENIPKKFDALPQLLDGIQKVCIENQPTLKNPTMKTIQIIIYSYFLIRGKTDGKSPIQQISFISATNKLKVYDGPPVDPDLYTKSGNLKKIPKGGKPPKGQPLIIDYMEKENEIEAPAEEEEEEKPKTGSGVCYGDKKKLAILYTREMIKKDHSQFLEYFEGNKKKDDLSDSFLQGVYVLTKEEIQQRQKEVKDAEKKNQPKKPRAPRKKKETVLDQLQESKEEKPKPKRGRKKKGVDANTIHEEAYLHDSSGEE